MKRKIKVTVKVTSLSPSIQSPKLITLCYTAAETQEIRWKGNSAMESLPLAKLIKALASMHQSQHQAVVFLHANHKQRIQALLQAQQKDGQVLWALVEALGTPAAAPVVAAGFPHTTLYKNGAAERSRGICGSVQADHRHMGVAGRSMSSVAATAPVRGKNSWPSSCPQPPGWITQT